MNLDFNSKKSFVMHIDLNSCFASVEQQANPFLRGKPVAVAAYNSLNGCILAASYEAKRFGVKTGMRVKEGRALCPDLLTLAPDPPKYRHVHLALRRLLSCYTDDFYPKSIDEFVLNLEGYPALKNRSMADVGVEIKRKIKEEVGDSLTVSIGIAPNRFLAKLASNLHKPDGLDEINIKNFKEIYRKVTLIDLYGINVRNAIRLKSVGINSPLEFYEAPLWKLKAAFKSIAGYYWYTRLRGHEIDGVEFGRRSYGNSYALPKPLASASQWRPILAKLINKTSFRLRRAGLKTSGIHIAVSYRDGSYWQHGEKLSSPIFDTRDIFREAFRLLNMAPKKPVRVLAESCFNLSKKNSLQLSIFEDAVKKEKLVASMDMVNNRWGEFVLTTGNMMEASNAAPDRIAFGGVKELEEIALNT